MASTHPLSSKFSRGMDGYKSSLFCQANINKNLSGNPVSSSEILAFIMVELMLLFYRVLPSLYFDLDERSNFPSAGQGKDYA